VHSGGLAPKTLTTVTEVRDQLLYEKRYSLLWESGSRWVDTRLYGLLATLPKDAPSHRVHANFPISQDEELARGGAVRCQ
jgi:hypothetical protein